MRTSYDINFRDKVTYILRGIMLMIICAGLYLFFRVFQHRLNVRVG